MDPKLIQHVAQYGSPAEQVAMRAATRADAIPTIAEVNAATQRNSMPNSAGIAKWSYEMAQQDAMKACSYATDYLANGPK